MLKQCSRCQVLKPLEDFYRKARNPDGRQRWCSQCAKTVKANYLANPENLEKNRAYARKHREALLSTAEGREKVRQYTRMYYLKRKQEGHKNG